MQNLRPYFKFTLPTLEILSVERDIWDQANSDLFDPNQVLSRAPLVNLIYYI
jgi:hypothetical protein